MREDYAKFAGLSSEEDLEEPILTSVKKRIPWLLTLLFLGLMISLVISGFESVVISLPMLVFFQSLILGMAGNAGTQSLAVTIRVLTDSKISNKKLIKMIFKEFRVGFANGFTLSILSFFMVLIFLSITKSPIVIEEDFSYNLAIKAAGVVSIALLCAITLSSLIGTVVPIVLSKIHVDPAVASGPFITTMIDVIAVLVYYGLAILLFSTFIK